MKLQKIKKLQKTKKLIKDIRKDIILKEEKCFIVNEKQSIELIQASSGQQEALPMLQTLAVLSIFSRNTFTFIEEPEAHLFPIAQKYIVQIIAFLYNLNNINFITTHSL